MNLLTSNHLSSSFTAPATAVLEKVAHPQTLLHDLQRLRHLVVQEGGEIYQQWRSLLERPTFSSSALNLAHYLALRRHDMRQLQLALMPWGLSSLGRIEARVLANLEAVIATLGAVCGKDPTLLPKHPPLAAFFEGDRLLTSHTIGYSFVQRAADIEMLQLELQSRLGEKWRSLALVAKIETAAAVKNLPELIVHAAGKQPFGVMIARGDLAVEIGYQRLAEIQEEILWLCQAAQIPVIWATQVLENLVKKSIPSRAEITDAAMGERAECVMLNKGAFVLEAVTILDDVLARMESHQLKKTPQLRALHSW